MARRGGGGGPATSSTGSAGRALALPLRPAGTSSPGRPFIISSSTTPGSTAGSANTQQSAPVTFPRDTSLIPPSRCSSSPKHPRPRFSSLEPRVNPEACTSTPAPTQVGPRAGGGGQVFGPGVMSTASCSRTRRLCGLRQITVSLLILNLLVCEMVLMTGLTSGAVGSLVCGHWCSAVAQLVVRI